MPTLTDHPSTKAIKMLLMGDSGSGKTGALASLVNSGLKLNILDYDNGLDALRRFVEPKFLNNVNYHLFQDKFKFQGTTIVGDGAPDAFVRGAKLLAEPWPGGIGRLTEWGPDTVFALDSLTFFGMLSSVMSKPSPEIPWATRRSPNGARPSGKWRRSSRFSGQIRSSATSL